MKMTNVERHFARTVPFAELYARLIDKAEHRLVNVRRGEDGLVIFNYSNHCVFDAAWDDVTRAARGLVLDVERGRVAATPFPKFFNVGEHGVGMPDLPFEVFEKLDGSLVILFWHEGRWRTATRGAFESAQARWALGMLESYDLSGLDRATTWLFEAIYPENRIVVPYSEAALVMLGAYDGEGVELSYADIREKAAAMGTRAAERYSFASVTELLETADALPRDEEGYILLFQNGLRQKLKGGEYRRIHAIISRVTPLGVWNMMNSGDDLEEVRRLLPEELYIDFDRIRAILERQFAGHIGAIETAAASVADLSDKELGLKLGEFPRSVGKFLFHYRKQANFLDNAKNRAALYREFRPTGDELEGYERSDWLTGVMAEAG